MGYTNQESCSEWIPFTRMSFVTGTWTDTVASNIWSKNHTAAGETSTIRIPVSPLQNSKAQNQVGALISSIDVWYSVGTAALVAMTAQLYRLSAPANTAAFGTPANPAFTYDTGHDTAAKRYAVQAHKMTITLTTPIWLSNEDILHLELSANCAGTSVLKIYDARVNYTLRV